MFRLLPSTVRLGPGLRSIHSSAYASRGSRAAFSSRPPNLVMPAEGSKVDGGHDNSHNAVNRVLPSEKKHGL